MEEDNMLYLVKEDHKAEPEIYRLGWPMKNPDGSIMGYTECSKIVEWDGKKLAFGGTWIPVGLVVRRYGMRCDCERRKAYIYNMELDVLLLKEAERKAALEKYYLAE
jgi:hypothetical protein